MRLKNVRKVKLVSRVIFDRRRDKIKKSRKREGCVDAYMKRVSMWMHLD